MLDALVSYHAENQTPFTPPGHTQGRGADPRGRVVLGEAVLRSDVRVAVVEVPDPARPRLERVTLPRDAFFGRAEQVPWGKAVGRVSTEMLTPCPPGIPAAPPGERPASEVLRCLRSGVEAGTVVPDAADPEAGTVRVTAEE